MQKKTSQNASLFFDTELASCASILHKTQTAFEWNPLFFVFSMQPPILKALATHRKKEKYPNAKIRLM